MRREIVFVLEPDAGRVTVESSQVSSRLADELKRDLGASRSLNCGRPQFSGAGGDFDDCLDELKKTDSSGGSETIYLFRLYHHSTVDGPGRRSVVQVAGCSIRCEGCYVPETHDRANGSLVSVERIVREIESFRGEHDGVTILGGEPFDQTEALLTLVRKLKERNFHLVIYSGFTLEALLARDSENVRQILAHTDMLIDGAFIKDLSNGAGEYRGSSNQRVIYDPLRFEYERRRVW